MIFAKYLGGATVGRYTKGRIYMAKDSLEGVSAEGIYIHVDDDFGATIRFERDDGCFEVLNEIYACCVKTVANLEIGEIVRIKGADEDVFDVVGFGWTQSKFLEIIDDTNLTVESYAQEIKTGKWSPIKEINGYEIRVNGHLHQLDDFRLPVSDGAISTIPLAKCIDASGTNLEECKEYVIKRESSHEITVDMGKKTQVFEAKRFTRT